MVAARAVESSQLVANCAVWIGMIVRMAFHPHALRAAAPRATPVSSANGVRPQLGRAGGEEAGLAQGDDEALIRSVYA